MKFEYEILKREDISKYITTWTKFNDLLRFSSFESLAGRIALLWFEKHWNIIVQGDFPDSQQDPIPQADVHLFFPPFFG